MGAALGCYLRVSNTAGDKGRGSSGSLLTTHRGVLLTIAAASRSRVMKSSRASPLLPIVIVRMLRKFSLLNQFVARTHHHGDLSEEDS